MSEEVQEAQPKNKGGRPPTPEHIKQRVIAAGRVGIPAEKLAEDLRIGITTVRNIWREERKVRKDDEEVTTTANLDYVDAQIWAMEALHQSNPAEWLKRFRGKQHYASIDKADVSISSNSDKPVKIHLDFSGNTDG